MHRRAFCLAVAGLAASAPVAAGRATPVAGPTGHGLPLRDDRRTAFADDVAAKLAEFGVPGAAVAVVQHGEVVFLEGFGEAELGGGRPVGPDTLMMVGSVTKPMTAMLAATLVDDGRLAWDAPLTDLLPDFRTADPALTARLTVADAFCMCTGIPRRDAEFMLRSGRLEPTALVASIAEMPPTAPFGERYQYSNQTFAVGGYAAAVAAGAARDDLFAGYRLAMRERLLGPIGMDRSGFDLATVLADGDYAVGHGVALDGAPRPVPPMQEDRFVEAVAPAGALWSSAREMARFAQTVLAGGVAPGGQRVVSAAALARLWEPRIAIPADPASPHPPFDGASAYATGWYVGAYAGRRVVAHGGGTFGFASLVSLMPEAGLGLVVLTNGIAGGLAAPFVQHRLFELVFDRPARGEALLTPFVEATVEQFAQVGAALGEVDPAAAAPFVGRYANPTLGEATVTLRGNELRFDTGAVGSALRPLSVPPGEPTPYVFADPPLTTVPAAVVFVPGPGGPPTVLLNVLVEGGDSLTYPYERLADSAA